MQFKDLTLVQQKLAQAAWDHKGCSGNIQPDTQILTYREARDLDSIEYLDATKESSLPHVVIKHHDTIAIRENEDYGKDLNIVIPEQITLCNFRRYAWGWTHELEGKHGYGYGVTYVNGLEEMFNMPKTAEDVLIQSFIVTMAQIAARDMTLSWLVYGEKGQVALKKLLAESLTNPIALETAARKVKA